MAVYKASLDTAPANGRMPDGCRLLAQKPPVDMTELEIEGQKDPYRVFRNEAGAAGANALLARSRVIVSRRNFECPSASRITDCPGSSGAWLRVVFETYACTPEALRDLDARRDAAGAHP